MDFKKKFEYEDLTNYLPDNWTLGRSEFYQHKFNDKMPLYICDILEINSRKEFNDDHENIELIKLIKEAKKQSDINLMKEYEERNKPLTDEEIEFEKKILSVSTLLEAAEINTTKDGKTISIEDFENIEI